MIEEERLVADRLCRNWTSIVGGEHLHTQGGCPLHRAIAKEAVAALVDR